MYTQSMYAMTFCMNLVSWKGGYIECTVNAYDHALKLNEQYLTLL